LITQNVDKLITHFRPHQDELCGAWQFYRFGEPTYVGASTANVQFVKADWKRYPKNVIALGIGFGPFDEHRCFGGRIPDECCATLVNKRLRPQLDFDGLLGEVLWCDTNGGVSPTQLANLIKAKHRVNNGKNQLGTLRWAYDAFDAIVSGEQDESFDICADWNQFFQAGKFTTRDDIVKKVTLDVIDAFNRQDDFLTEIASVAAFMKPEIRASWLPVAFKIMLRDAELFDEALAEINTKARYDEIPTKDGPEPLCIIETDSEHATAAFSAKAGLAALLITRSSVGHTCVFVSPRSALPTTFLAGMIRMAEYKAWTGRSLPFDKACCEGTLKECPQWHLANRKMLLNGSLTHPDVSPSKLSLDTLVSIASVVYDDKLRRSWIDSYYAEDKKVTSDKESAAVICS
jgi:hypothetical protein